MAGRVLVVEDDPAIRETLVELLGDTGYEAVGAANGREAMELLLGPGERPSLILLDMMMPVMDGGTFRHAQLATPELASIPVVVLSADRDLSRVVEDLHVQGVLAKPLRLTDLLETVERICAAA